MLAICCSGQVSDLSSLVNLVQLFRANVAVMCIIQQAVDFSKLDLDDVVVHPE